MGFKKLSVFAAAVLVLSMILAVPASAGSGVKEPNNPVVTGVESWESQGVGAAAVILDGGAYHMWYSAKDADGFDAIGHAVSQDGINWVKDADPVVSKGQPGDWDSNGAGASSVIKDGDTYRMWYSGRDAGDIARIGYATATVPQGPWNKNGTHVLEGGSGGAWDEDGVAGPSVIKDGSGYKMWYTGRHADADPTNLLGHVAIGYAEAGAPEGPWTKEATNPVFAGAGSGEWDERGVGAATVIKQTVLISNPVGTQSYYVMYYTGFDAAGGPVLSRIGGAKSGDGITNWERFSVNPLLSVGDPGSWDEKGVGSLAVIKADSGGQTWTWFTGTRADLIPSIGHATVYRVQNRVLPTGWNMMALPVYPVESDSFATVLGDDIASGLFIYHYDPALGRYKMWPNETVPAEAGSGYWVRAYSATPVDAEGATVQTADYGGSQAYAIHVKAGWNQIGGPFDYSVAWGNARFKRLADGAIETIGQAHINSHVSKFIYGYDTSLGQYVMKDDTNGVLESWNGYWVRAYEEGDLLIAP